MVYLGYRKGAIAADHPFAHNQTSFAPSAHAGQPETAKSDPMEAVSENLPTEGNALEAQSNEIDLSNQAAKPFVEHAGRGQNIETEKM